MGGSYETSVAPPPGVQANDVRIHENAGQVHLHDDKAGLKVEVPSADFKKRMSDLDDPSTTSVEFKDAVRSTRAVIEKDGKGDVSVKVEKFTLLGRAFQSLKDFAGKL